MDENDLYWKLYAVLKKKTNVSSAPSSSLSAYNNCENTSALPQVECEWQLLHQKLRNESTVKLPDYQEVLELVRPWHQPWWKIILMCLYICVIVFSLIGNSFVCRLIFKHRKIQLTMINTFIFNMAMSDLLMTVFNIPFSLIRIYLDDWPFGSVLCVLVPLIQVTSVYVSTFTMTFIALDRHQAIMKPMEQRLFYHGDSKISARLTIIGLIWVISVTLSLPHGAYNVVSVQVTYRTMKRCISSYPSIDFRKWLTLVTFLTQYVIPLAVTSFAYTRLVGRIHCRTCVGAATATQVKSRVRAKRRTIIMLVIVMVVFAVCWLPLNIYHIACDFYDSYYHDGWLYRSYILLPCHLLAMSSVCYNPFIYCWLNEQFNRGAKQLTRLVCKPCVKKKRPLQLYVNKTSTSSAATSVFKCSVKAVVINDTKIAKTNPVDSTVATRCAYNADDLEITITPKHLSASFSKRIIKDA